MWSLGVSGITSLGTLRFYLTNQAHIVNALQHTTAQYHPNESFPLICIRRSPEVLFIVCYAFAISLEYISEIKGSLLFLRVGCRFNQWNAVSRMFAYIGAEFLGQIF